MISHGVSKLRHLLGENYSGLKGLKHSQSVVVKNPFYKTKGYGFTVETGRLSAGIIDADK